MIKLITYSNDLCSISRIHCAESAYKHGAEQVFQYEPHHIDQNFKEFNSSVLSAVKGNGFWLWKPYFIHRAMGHCADGDTLVYCDAGVEIISPLQEIINVMDQDIFLFSNGHQHIHWCKADVLKTITGIEFEQTNCGTFYSFPNGIAGSSTDFQQVQASVIFFRVTEFTRKFVREWLAWSQIPGFIDDTPSAIPNHPEFAEHRYDQAILTCMQIKYGLKLHWWADKMWYESQRYRWPEDRYPSMFRHHRKRNYEW